MTLLLKPKYVIWGDLLQRTFEPKIASWDASFVPEAAIFSHEPQILKRFQCAADETLFYLPKGDLIEEPISLSLTADATDLASYIAPLSIHLGSGSQATLIITAPLELGSKSLLSLKLRITVEADAHLKLIFVQPPHTSYSQMRHLQAAVKARGKLSLVYVHLAPELMCSETQVDLKGEEASCDIRSLGSLDDREQLHQKIIVKHDQPNTHSKQTVHTLLYGKSCGSFAGEIHVDTLAQKTEAYQMSRFLLLSKEATAFTSPHLFIHADDVKASHGATISDLDQDEALFYLRSRGVSQDAAQEMLTKSFCQPILEGLPEPLLQQLSAWL